MEKKKSFIRNWHEPKFWARTKKKFGASVFPFLNTYGNIELRIDLEGKQLTIELTGEERALFLMNMDRFIYKKENVKRTDYGLSNN